MADNVAVVFSAQIGELIDEITEVKRAILSIADPINDLKSTFSELSEAFAAAFAIHEIDEFFAHFAELAVQTERSATLLGVSTEQIGGLDIAAKASGGSLEGMVSSMERLGMSLARASGGSAQAKAGLEALGISVKDFQALSPERQLETLADKFSVLKDGIDKDAIAMAIMGRAGAQMIPIFNGGARSLEEFQEMAQRTGTALSGETVAAFAATHLALIELSKSFEGAGLSVASIFKPAFDGVVKILIDVVQAFNDAIKAGGSLSSVMNAVAFTVKVLASALAVLIQSVRQVYDAFNLAADGLYAFTSGAGAALNALQHGNFSAMKESLQGMPAAMKAAWDNFTTSIASSNHALDSELRAIWTSGAEEQVKIAQTKTARLNILNKDSVASELAAAQEKIKIADMQYAQTAEKLNSQYKQMQLTESQKTQALLAALDVRHAAEMAAVGEEMAVHNMSKAQYQKVLNEKLQLDQKYAQDKQKIVDQAAETEAKTWKAGADQVAGAFNSQLKGLLTGQESFGQAMRAMSGDLALKLIQDADKWAIEWIAAQLRTLVMGTTVKTADVTATAAAETAKTTAVVTGASARETAETAGASVGILAQVGNAIAVIGADAAKTFAGVFAFLSPTMGPAAAGPAASSAAAVEASAAGVVIPGAATGGYVLSDGLAMIHAGETVTPASMVQPYDASMGGASGGSHTINVTLNGAGGLNASLVQQYGRMIASEVARQFNTNPTLRPAY